MFVFHPYVNYYTPILGALVIIIGVWQVFWLATKQDVFPERFQ
jgi:hypothetical protein